METDGKVSSLRGGTQARTRDHVDDVITHLRSYNMAKTVQNLAEKQKNHVFLTNPQNIEKHTEAGRGKGDPKHSKTCVFGSDQKHSKTYVFLGLTKNTEKHVYHL